MRLGKTVREIRIRRGFTQKELADETNLSQTYLSLIENGKREPSLSTVESIGNALGIPSEIIAFLSLRAESIHPDKRELFEKVSPSIRAMITEYFSI